MKPVQSHQRAPVLQTFAKQMFAIARTQRLIFNNPIFRAFRQRLDAVRNNPLPKNHPLQNIEEALKKNTVYKTSSGPLQLGAHFFPYGGPIVKGMNLVLLDRGGWVELNFNINHVHKKKLMQNIRSYQLVPANRLALFPFYLNGNPERLTLTTSRRAIPYSRTHSPLTDWNSCMIHTLRWQGTIIEVAENPSGSFGNITNRIVLQFNKATKPQKVRELLAIYGLAKTLTPSSEKEIERMKIGLLYRTYHPRKALPLERSSKFFSLPLDILKTRIVEKASDMRERFVKELPNMHLVETVPGRKRFANATLVKQAENAGATALVHETYSERIPDILRTGLLSNELSGEYGRHPYGTWSYREGTRDIVFMHMATNNSVIYPYTTSWPALIVSTKALETSPYQYEQNPFGTRTDFKLYSKRPSLIELTQKIAPKKHSLNEIMIKDRIPPKYILGCVTNPNNGKDKQEILQLLRKERLLTRVGKKEFINGIPINDFFIEANAITPEIINKLRNRKRHDHKPQSKL